MTSKNTRIIKSISLISCLLLLTLAISLQGQTERIDWNKVVPASSEEEILDIIETSNGYVVGVGFSNSTSSKRKDGLLVISDFYTGEILHKKELGKRNDDVLQAVVQHWDGTLYLAGYTSGKGGQDAWLLNVDTEGTILWEKTFGTAKADAFQSLAITKSGDIVAAGNLGGKEGQVWMVKLDRKSKGIIAEYNLGNGALEGLNDMVITSDDAVVMTGNTRKAKKRKPGDIWMLKANLDGNTEWLKFYGGNGWDEALALTATQNNGFAIAGLTKSKGEGEMDMWIVKTNSLGEVEWDRTYGGSDEDIAHDIVQTYDSGYAMVGITKSHKRGARRYNMSLIKTDAYGTLELQETFGGNKEDLGNCIAKAHDGSLLLGGSTASKGKGSKDAWIIKTTSNKEDMFAYAAASNSLAASIVTLEGTKVKNLLSANDKAYISFEVTNRSNSPLLNVFAEIKPLLQMVGLSYWDQLVIGDILPNQTKRISIPVSGDDRLQEGMSNFQINLFTGNKTLQSIEANVFSSEVLPAALGFGDHKFATPGTRGGSFKAVLEVNIQNYGEQSAKDIKGEFIPPDGVKPIDKPTFTIDYLRPNSTHKAAFDFLVSSTAKYPDGKIKVKCILKEGNGEKTIEDTFTLNIEKPNTYTSGTRSPRSSKDLIWISPNPDESGSRLISDKEYVDIKIKAVSNKELKADDFTIYLNNNSQDGSKFDKPELSKGNRRGAAYTQTYENKVQLKLGENIIEVEVLDEMGNVKTIPIRMTYAPERPNLHILAIGPTHEDLKYTGKDAKDFANAFLDQENKLFNKVFIRSLSEKETTKKDDIKRALVDLQINYEANTAEAITDKDLLIVFISSHAKKDGRNFKILPSDFQPKYESIYALDYELDIVQYLKNINCKKLMFIDACNSGAAFTAVSGVKSYTENGLADAINTINRTLPGMSTITSCRKQEKSYEDEQWENGAFTEGILEAFANRSFTDKTGRNYRPDMDDDGILTLGELKIYLEKRVPHLVETQKKDAPTSQVPVVTNNKLGDKFPLYVLDGK